MVKNPKNLLLQNQKVSVLETWYVVCRRSKAHYSFVSLFYCYAVFKYTFLSYSIEDVGPTKFGQMMTLTYLTSRSNLLPNAFKWIFFEKLII